jgi:hypothetical protein
VVVVNVKKLAGWGAVIFMMWFVITQPDGAAGMLQNAGSSLEGAAQGMSSFFTQLF